MTLEFTEYHSQGMGTTIEVERTLCREQSLFQDIMIVETRGLGRMMVIDGCVMLTERYEYLYHEMLVHPIACCHAHPQKALVIGGGDGGTVRELLHYPSITSIDLVEIDEAVVRLSRKYLPQVSCGFDNPRVSVHITDGVEYLRHAKGSYDLIMIDSTDPVGPAEGLITQTFYQSCQQALRPGGILSLQSESPFVHEQELQRIWGNIGEVFSECHLYHGPIPMYPSGWWSFVWASDSRHPQNDFQTDRARWVSQHLRHYNAEMHGAMFVLPNFLHNMLHQVQSVCPTPIEDN